MDRRIVIVTDSTANLPPELVKQFDIPIIPLNIHWGGQDYLDGVTLNSDEFYQWLGNRPETPTTSQPSVGRFIEFFKEVAARYRPEVIIGIFISSKMSGTFSSALQARAELPQLKIELIDSHNVSMGLGFQVLAGVRAVQAGMSLPTVTARIEDVRSRIQLLFMVDTLDYLHRGGRIGGAAHFVGTMLNLKPLLSVVDGRINSVDKVRGRNRSLQRLMDLAAERAGGKPVKEVGIFESGKYENVEWVWAQVQERLHPEYIYRTLLTPVVGTHAGPGVVGLVFPGE